ncbi:MAG: hypothetical protein AB1757_28810 [Acidobacteriota bacterium]
MKKTIYAMVASFALVLSLALSNVAADVTKSFTLTRDSKIKGQPLTKGDYSVKFADDKEGELVVMKGKKEIVKSTYKIITLNEAPSDNKIAYTVSEDGSFTVKRIEFKGSKTAISFE